MDSAGVITHLFIERLADVPGRPILGASQTDRFVASGWIVDDGRAIRFVTIAPRWLRAPYSRVFRILIRLRCRLVFGRRKLGPSRCA